MSDKIISDKNLEEIRQVRVDTVDAIHFAILRVLGKDKEGNGCLQILGIEMALLHCAARVAIVQQEACGACKYGRYFCQPRSGDVRGSHGR